MRLVKPILASGHCNQVNTIPSSSETGLTSRLFSFRAAAICNFLTWLGMGFSRACANLSNWWAGELLSFDLLKLYHQCKSNTCRLIDMFS